MNKFFIIIDSDPQFGYGGSPPRIRKSKSKNVELMKKVIDRVDVKSIIVSGDLTEHNSDGKHFGCYRYGGNVDEYTPLIQEYVSPLMNTGVRLRMIPGNHDHFISGSRFPYLHKPSIDLIKGLEKLSFFSYEIGDVVYSFDIEGIHFCALDVYPNKKVCKWLKKDLKGRDNQPIVLIQHYDCDATNEWWKKEEKDKYYDTIKDYNVILIIEGHEHSTSFSEKFHGIPRLRAAGRGFCVIEFRSTGNMYFHHIVSEDDLEKI